MSRNRVKKSPAYRALEQRNANQAEHIRALSREYQGKYLDLDLKTALVVGNRSAIEMEAGRVAAERSRLHERYAWGFWRRLRFAVMGR